MNFDRNLRLFLFLALLLSACKEKDSFNLIQMDDYLCENWIIDHKYLETELKKFSDSEYLNSMLIYFDSDSSNVDKYFGTIDSLKKNRNWNGSYIDLAYSRLLKLRGDTIQAKSILESAFKKDSTNHWLLFELSDYLNGIENKIDALDKAIAIKSNFYRAKIFKAFYLDTTKDSKNVILLIQSTDTIPLDVNILNLLAEAYFFSGNVDESDNLYRKSLNIHPSVEAYVGLGSTYHYQKPDFDISESYLKKAYELDSTNISSIRSLGWLYYDNDNFDLADYYFNKLFLRSTFLNEADIKDLLDYYIITKNRKVAEVIVGTLKEKYQENYEIIGYDLIVNYLKEGDEGNDIYLQLYEKNFGDQGRSWLKDKFLQLDIDISSRIKVDKPNL